MKILLIHGNDVEASRRRLQKFTDTAVKRKWDIVRIDGGTDRLNDAISAQDLFKTPRLIIVESAHKITKSDRDWLLANNQNYTDTVVFYAPVILSKAVLDGLGKIDKPELFQKDVSLWKFLESVKKGNAKTAITLLHKALASDPPEYVLAMLARQMKDLYQVKVAPETLSIPDWRLQKLRSQATSFDQSTLTKFISGLAEIDIRTKTTNDDLQALLDYSLIINLE